MTTPLRHSTYVVLLSGPGGSILRTYGTSTGHLLLEHRLQNPPDVQTHDVQHTVITAGGVSVAGDTVFLSLTNGDAVSCIDRSSNDVARIWNSLDNGFAQYSSLQQHAGTIICPL
ncbi:hypothetical protein BKA82DRAFT_4051061 [Pisolithus tinctorius]|nr:hypothetical protein BKA82DRAFT_4051061 [Pisolithus tinctorius]